MANMKYQPAAYALDRLKRVDFVAVVGPTAVGKTTIIKAAVKQSAALHMLVAGTSRGVRAGERGGVDFYFGNLEDMQKRAARGEYVTAVVGASGDLYTTAPEDYPLDKTVLMATLAQAVASFRTLPYRTFRTIFIVPPSWEAWQERLQLHRFTPEQLASRMAEARVSLQFALDDTNVRFVINDELDKAVDDFVILSLGKPISKHSQDDQRYGRTLVRNLIDRLSV